MKTNYRLKFTASVKSDFVEIISSQNSSKNDLKFRIQRTSKTVHIHMPKSIIKIPHTN